MASSLAKEFCLSPVLKSSTLRRRSLDLCQQIGSQLLSPHLLQQLTPSSPKSPNASTKNPNSPFKLINDKQLSPSISPVFSFNNNDVSTTEQFDASPSQVYHSKRRASDSLWLVESLQRKVATFENKKEKDCSRRRSLTPQHPSSCSDKLRNKEKESCEGSVENITQEDESKHAKEIGSDSTNEAFDALDKNEQAATTANRDVEKELKILCNIIPPTPQKIESQQKKPRKGMSPLQCELISENFGNSSSSDSENEEKEPNNMPDQVRNRVSSFQKGLQYEPCSKSVRCSAGAKYDLDDNLMKLIALHWNLSLNPDELLGKGSFGTVIGGLYQGEQVAVKILKATNAQRKAHILGEKNALILPSHNHIARTLDIFQLGTDRALIIMEKMHKGNLFTLLNDSSFTMNCSIAINICKQVALGLIFCHRHGILHLDVKPQNVLVDLRNCCKLSDFGSSKKVTDLQSSYQHVTFEGTIPYTAPELFRGATPTEKCDVYSFGITMWQIITKEIPYEDENGHTVIFRVVSQGLRPGNNNEPITSVDTDDKILVSNYVKLYQEAWDADPRLRPTMIDLHRTLIQIQFFELS